MRLLVDRNLRPLAADLLRERGHGVVHAENAWSIDPGDEAILRHAHAGDRIVVTRDKDCGARSVIAGLQHRGSCAWMRP